MFNLWIALIFAVVPSEENIANKIQSEKQKYIQKDEQVRSYLSDLYRLQRNIKKMTDEAKELEAKKTKIMLKIRKISKAIKTTEAEIAKTQKILQLRIRLASQILDSSLKEIIVFSKSPNEIERILLGLESIMEKDIGMIKNIEVKKKELSQNQIDLKSEIANFSANKKQLKSTVTDLLRFKNKKEKTVAKLKKDKDKHEIALKILREKGENIVILSENLSKRLAKEILIKSFFEYKGQLPQPIEGKIVEKFGESRDDKLRFLNKGIWLSGQYLQEIKAVARGRVAFVGRINKQTKAIVVEHDNNYYSVYAPIKKTKLKENDIVSFQQEIASLDKGGKLYFELRHYSEPLNPQNWFKTYQKSLAKKGKQHEIH